MTRTLAVYHGRRTDIATHVLVDDDDYERLAAYRWVVGGPAEAPDHIYRYLAHHERQGSAHATVLTQAVLPHTGYIAFRNGCRLDYRKANLISRAERQSHIEQGARRLLQMNPDGPQTRGEAVAILPLKSPWEARIDPSQMERLSAYRWTVTLRGQSVYALRRPRKPDGGVATVYLARVIMGLQDIQAGKVLRPGVVTLKAPPDFEHCRLDLRASNLIVTTRGGINMRRPRKRRYRGVQRTGRGRYRAYMKLAGCERILGLYDSPEAAARVRDAEIIRLGLQELARLNFPGRGDPQG
jgi:hypothetical protein